MLYNIKFFPLFFQEVSLRAYTRRTHISFERSSKIVSRHYTLNEVKNPTIARRIVLWVRLWDYFQISVANLVILDHFLSILYLSTFVGFLILFAWFFCLFADVFGEFAYIFILFAVFFYFLCPFFIYSLIFWGCQPLFTDLSTMPGVSRAVGREADFDMVVGIGSVGDTIVDFDTSIEKFVWPPVDTVLTGEIWHWSGRCCFLWYFLWD